jgi:hypothetical protein
MSYRELYYVPIPGTVQHIAVRRTDTKVIMFVTGTNFRHLVLHCAAREKILGPLALVLSPRTVCGVS